jgi:peptidoglycan/LPS O-acetylase OafA/YrhL
VLNLHVSHYFGFSFVRSYLAVDVFFLLSGFVIAHAYDARLATRSLTPREFIGIRIARLYPMYLLSALLCAAVLVGKLAFDARTEPELLRGAVLASALAVVGLPFSLQGNPYLFPLNHTHWSLFFEIGINALYGGARPRFSLLAVSVAGLVVAAACAAYIGNLSLGFEWGTVSIVGGCGRAIFGIFFGAYLYQKREMLTAWLGASGGYGLPMLAIALALMVPAFGAGDWIYDVAVVACVFPVCILAAAQTEVRHGVRVLSLLGLASYPVYLFHLPVAHVLSKVMPGVDERFAPFSGIALIALLVAFAVVAERVYDRPFRAWLRARLVEQHHRFATNVLQSRAPEL